MINAMRSRCVFFRQVKVRLAIHLNLTRPKQEGSAMIRRVTWTGFTVFLLVATLSHPDGAAGHGGMSGEDDPCLRQVGESLVHFNAYQPQYQLRDQYCTDIPKEGDTILVVDLVDPALRNEPVGMRIMKGNGSNEAEDMEDMIVADIRPSTHPDGVLRGEVKLDEGQYRVIIAAEKQNLMRRPQYLLRVHMTDYQKLVSEGRRGRTRDCDHANRRRTTL
jgi:hypothetical protein